APEPPDAARIAARDRLRAGDVASARALRHPLPARPELVGVTAGQVRHDATRQIGAGVLDQRAGGAVRRGEVAGVDGGARPVEREQGELVDAREGTEVALVRDGGETPL